MAEPDAWQNAPSLGEMSAMAAGQSNGLRCPSCGGTLVVYKTAKGATRIVRYVNCINPSCERRFVTKQTNQEIVREVVPKKDYPKDSNTGNKNR